METETLTDPVQHELQVPQWGLASRVAFRFCFVYLGLFCLTTQVIARLISASDPRPSHALAPAPTHLLDCHPHLACPGNSGFRLQERQPRRYVRLGLGILPAGYFRPRDRPLVYSRPQAGKLRQVAQVVSAFHSLFPCRTDALVRHVQSHSSTNVFPSSPSISRAFWRFFSMGILWSSIGAFPAYEIFTGCAEVFGGLLLIVPRTATLGALVCLAEMIQVFTLNMTYDVPVKLFSFHLILLSLFLLAPDLPRLINFFFLNRTTAPSAQAQLFSTRRANQIALTAQILFGLWLLGMNAYCERRDWYIGGGGQPKSPLYGIWEVDQQTMDGQLRSPLLNDYGRWRRVIFDFPDRVTFQRMDDSFARHPVTINVKDKTLVLNDDVDKNWKANFTFARVAPGQLILDGKLDDHQTQLQLRLVDLNKFALVNRGFHWIQEHPFNR